MASVRDVGQMQAAVFAGPGRIELRLLPVPQPGAGQVRVRMEGCGLCSSNLPAYEGRDWYRYPFPPGAPGHEGWGVVDAVGAGGVGPRVGDRVATLSSTAFAEYDVVDSHATVTLPGALAGQDFPGEPLGCAMNVFSRSQVRRGQTVAVVGVGFLGAVLVRLCANAGARVIALARRPFARKLALALGAKAALPFEDAGATVARVRELNEGKLCERVIEAVGEQRALDLSSELTQERGRLIIAGYHQDGLRQVNLQQWNWRGLDVINAHERDMRTCVGGMLGAVDAAASGVLDLPLLLTHRLGLSELPRGFVLMQQRPEGFLKAFVTFEGRGPR